VKAQQRGISYAEMERTAFSYTSIKEYVTPEQLADQIVFICSPRGRTISGQAISICGDDVGVASQLNYFGRLIINRSARRP